MAKFDFVSVGAAGIDILLDIHGKNDAIKFNDSSKEVSIKSGQKIILDGYKFTCGQNAANLAVGAARLGLNSTIFAEVGSDDFAKKIINDLEKEKVNTSNIKIESGDSSFSIILDFKNERTIFAENIKRNHDFSFKNISANFLYLTSLSRNWINAYMETLNFTQENKIPFAFSPGTAQIEDRDKIIFEVIKKSKILFLNKDEAGKLLSKKRSLTQVSEKGYVKNLLKEFKKLGASIVIITDGEKGSYSIDERGNAFFLNALATSVLEKTGAGDAYATAFIYGFIKNQSTQDSMIYGSINSSSVIERIGAQEGLLSSDILEDKAKHLENFKAIEI